MNTRIPNNIYMCDKTLNHIKIYSQNWKKLNPGYYIFLYDNLGCQKFLKKYYSDMHVDIFNFIPDGPIKADFWRVCIIYKYGGLYIDADIEPIIPLKNFIEKDANFVTCSSYSPNLNFNPNFFMAAAGNELLKKYINAYVRMYTTKVAYSYWGWSIMTLFNNILKLENFNKESGIYFDGSNKYQILKEIQAPEYKDDYNEYNGVCVFKNRYANYSNHQFQN
jgi:mannosyltransferase OCH1-like enzyme